MWPKKCLHSVSKLISVMAVMMVIVISISSLINAAPPPSLENSQRELRRVVRTPKENSARKFQSQVTSNPDLNYLKVDPQDLQVNQGDLSTFSVFLSKPLNEDIWVHFKCSGSNNSCNTFDLASLEQGVLIRPQDKQVTVNFTVHTPGHDVIDLEIDAQKSPGVNVSDDFAFVRVRVGHSTFLTILGNVFGWVYFLSWSISFWPQNISNFKRKSVVGLNFDYTILHFTGFLFYSIFNLLLFFSAVVQEEYEEKFPRSEIPVELNDVVYSLHAALATSITWCQCLIYKSGGQRLSIYGKLFQAGAWTVGAILMVLTFVHVLSWLTFIYYFSYVKLVITAVKYLPQVVFNWRRKSTAGWSIYMIYLDITGGTMSMLQMLTIAYNYDDWKTLVGNLPKLGLSIASILYDIIFLLQHFVFYPGTSHQDPSKTSESSSTEQKKDGKVVQLSRTSMLKKAGDSQDALFSGSSTSSDRSSLQSRTLSTASTDSQIPLPPPPPPPGFVVKSISVGDTTTEKDGAKTVTISGHPTNLDLSSHLDAIHLPRRPSDAKK